MCTSLFPECIQRPRNRRSYNLRPQYPPTHLVRAATTQMRLHSQIRTPVKLNDQVENMVSHAQIAFLGRNQKKKTKYLFARQPNLRPVTSPDDRPGTGTLMGATFHYYLFYFDHESRRQNKNTSAFFKQSRSRMRLACIYMLPILILNR